MNVLAVILSCQFITKISWRKLIIAETIFKMAITQAEYHFLMRQEKVFEDLVSSIQLGPAPMQWTRQINSLANKETFLFDFYRGSFELSKYTINERYR